MRAHVSVWACECEHSVCMCVCVWASYTCACMYKCAGILHLCMYVCVCRHLTRVYVHTAHRTCSSLSERDPLSPLLPAPPHVPRSPHRADLALMSGKDQALQAAWHSQLLLTHTKTLQKENEVGFDKDSTTADCGMGPSPPRLGTGLSKTLGSFLAAY